MSLPPPPTLLDLDIVLPIFVGIAVLTSSFRLVDRVRTARFGWDDGVCFLSLCIMLIMIVFFYLIVQPPPEATQFTQIFAYYAGGMCFHGVVWTARISILLTYVRIAAFSVQKRALASLAVLFAGLLLFLYGEMYWICEHETGWKEFHPPQCDLGKGRAITEICFDVFADITLVVVPVWLLSKSSMDKAQRMRLLLLFSTSFLITVVSVVQDVIVFIAGGIREIFASMLEDAFSLTICSVPVLVTSLYRIFSKTKKDLDVDTPKPPTLVTGTRYVSTKRTKRSEGTTIESVSEDSKDTTKRRDLSTYRNSFTAPSLIREEEENDGSNGHAQPSAPMPPEPVDKGYDVVTILHTV
ncbi:hypothetical protein DACRYDRAFT_79057 [Dacryopinax primogenitus]|uniref:Rhodopsin domain-containing protein n=1 Tax=Dacryopinax primogenitus (strain DJM 731) TaxID=1858805 RepID=M5G8V1_DACPD|nr:uncharacterized protein DACRYDRAFT_79057 [Dacryopinax primogenitus]EJU02292.1 hypothetical protein DACRYDRAFT_79057 [Dacryopinax primogenitus]